LTLNNPPLRTRPIQFALFVWLLSGCASQSPVKSVEMLDERTGLTMGALPQPMAFTETGIYDLLVPDKQPSIVYIGPVEWDRKAITATSCGFRWHRVSAVIASMTSARAALSISNSTMGRWRCPRWNYRSCRGARIDL
jgi:hypothetical protein